MTELESYYDMWNVAAILYARLCLAADMKRQTTYIREEELLGLMWQEIIPGGKVVKVTFSIVDESEAIDEDGPIQSIEGYHDIPPGDEGNTTL